MAYEGVVWIGGDPEPPAEKGEQQVVTWRWDVQSERPCPACLALDGHIIESILFVKHPGCACTLTPYVLMTFWGRFEISVSESWLLEEIGLVPGRGSRGFSQTLTPSGNLSFSLGGLGVSATLGQTTTLNNPGEEDVMAYAVYRVTETEYCDLWQDTGPSGGKEDWEDSFQEFHNKVLKVETVFVTLTTNPSQYE